MFIYGLIGNWWKYIRFISILFRAVDVMCLLKEKRRTREEERRARLQRLYDKEQRERAERNETKKITEFRNSKFERAALKEKSNDR